MGGRAEAKEGLDVGEGLERERRLKDWIEDMGRIWLEEGGVWITTRLVIGQAVKRIPSRGVELETVVRRILSVRISWSSMILGPEKDLLRSN